MAHKTTCVADLDPANVDAAFLRSIRRGDASRWIGVNYDTLVHLHQERCLDYIMNRLPNKTPPAHLVEYVGYSGLQLYKKASLSSAAHRAPLASNLFCAIYHDNVSCHKLVFNQRKLVELRGDAGAFLAKIRQFPDTAQNKIVEHLLAHPFLCNNPAYIMRQRVEALAREYNAPMTNFLSFSGFQAAVRKRFYDFATVTISPFLGMEEYSQDWVSQPFGFRIALTCSIMYDVCFDYFVLQDYSKCASFQGERLNKADTATLSAFLCATPEAQEDAIYHLFTEGNHL